MTYLPSGLLQMSPLDIVALSCGGLVLFPILVVQKVNPNRPDKAVAEKLCWPTGQRLPKWPLGTTGQGPVG